jgi:L-threonylcarbamoyladenylate synthase|tara:strand:+ start:2947 stop:3906 length:960 start_codon:yes stop_codon:yes gene_type:complete
MKNIYSNIYKVNKSNIARTVKYLKKDHVIGVPTETVYGLAGNAYSARAVKKIYELKNRPKINPLIIHYNNIDDLSDDAYLNVKFIKLYNKLCPGPVTFILKKKRLSQISKIATSGMSTVAVRFPKNKVIKNLLKILKFPLAIPSANKSNSISPIKPEDIIDEFGKKIKIILDGGKCKIGIESTVVDMTGVTQILRPGIIDSKIISNILKSKVSYKKNSVKIKAPGALRKHYSPGIPMMLNQKKCDKNNAFIIFGKRYKQNTNTFNLSKNSNLNEAARNLYKIFRKIKNKEYKKIYVVKIPNKKVGIAINDRLRRAAGKK